MKRISGDRFLVDYKENTLGVVKASSLAVLEVKQISEEGYFNSGMQIKRGEGGKSKIYVAYSNGTVNLINERYEVESMVNVGEPIF